MFLFLCTTKFFQKRDTIQGGTLFKECGMYFLICLAYAGVFCSLQPLTCYDFEFLPNSWKTLYVFDCFVETLEI